MSEVGTVDYEARRADEALERLAKLEEEIAVILHPSNRGTSGRLIIDASQEARIRKLIGR
jgi:hypothetical protein